MLMVCLGYGYLIVYIRLSRLFAAPPCVNQAKTPLCVPMAEYCDFALAGSLHVLAAMPSVCTKPQTWSCWTSAPSSWKASRTLSGPPRTTSCVPTSQNRREATCRPVSVSSSFLSALSFGRRTSSVSAVSVRCLCQCWCLCSHIKVPECWRQDEQYSPGEGNTWQKQAVMPDRPQCVQALQCA